MEPTHILIVEDEALLRRALRRKLEKIGYQVGEAETGERATDMLRNHSWDLVLLDIHLPDADGLELLKGIHGQDHDLPVIMVTGLHATEKVVTAMKNGAHDYITKPFNLDEMAITVNKALEMNDLRREVSRFRSDARQNSGFDRLIAKSPRMAAVMEMARTISESDAETILLLGESGTGKNLLAQAIHYNSKRASRPFLEVTCTALPDQLLESELFGHERGAFTDARQGKKGLCELAHRGTLFLDEIGDMSLGTQAKLLGFLESRSFRRVGGTRRLQVDLRIITATNRKMEGLIAEKKFREDLYYRLNVLEIEIPPLRERLEDIPLLAESFVDYFNRRFNKRVRGFDKKALQVMEDYSWPGNVRELRNAIERVMILTKKDTIAASELSLRSRGNAASETSPRSLITMPDQGVSLERVERELVRQALERTKGNQTRAAKLLHISRDQLRYRMKQYELL